MTAGTWLVLGATSPIARAFAMEAARHRCSLLLAGRDREDLETIASDLRIRTGRRVLVLGVEMENLDRHSDFVRACVEQTEGQLNVFCAVGSMPSQAAIDRDFQLALQTVMANYVGPLSVLHRLAPVLEGQGCGSVVVLGSIAGDRGRLKNYVYGSAKAGLHTYLQGLCARLFRSGVSVTTVKLGVVDTAMTWGLPSARWPADPQRVAQACWRFAEKKSESVYYPRYWALIALLFKLMPDRLFKRVHF